MTSLSDFPITTRWPAQNEELLQLYSYPTPNGQKISIALEELGIPYEVHRVTVTDADVKSPAFLSLNPNNKIPAILDPHGPDGAPIGLWESGAILIYLGEKSGALLGQNAREKAKVLQWIMFQMASVGPMFGQMGFFRIYGGKDMTDPLPRDRYTNEAIRILNVLEKELEGQDWICGAYSMADIAICPWLLAAERNYPPELLGFDALPNVRAYIARFTARPAVQRGLTIPQR